MHGERTITTLGARLAPRGDDDLPWAALGEADAVYLTAGDVEAVRLARTARILVVTPRAAVALDTITVDAVVYSANDEAEREAASSLVLTPGLLVATEGASGGSWLSDERGGGTLGTDEPARATDRSVRSR